MRRALPHRTSSAAIVAVFVVLALLSPGCAPTPWPSETSTPAPTEEPSGGSTGLGAGLGSIAVTWAHGFPSGELDLALVSTDDGTLTHLTSGPELDSSPAWSPDGSTIAFWRLFRDGSSPDGIYTMPAAGGGPTLRLETDLSISSISWSPQGDRIAFVGLEPRNGSELDSPSDVYTIAADGTGLQQVTSGGHVAEVAWSPDGARLAITREYALDGNRIGTDISVLDLATGDEQRLTDDGTAWKPSWSPDGTRIAFEAGEAGRMRRNDLFVMDADGSNRTRLTSTPEDEEGTAWAPDGTAIAVTRYVIGDVRDCDLVIVARDGSKERILLDGPIDGACPTSLSWEPLSRRWQGR